MIDDMQEKIDRQNAEISRQEEALHQKDAEISSQGEKISRQEEALHQKDEEIRRLLQQVKNLQLQTK
jgi:uncharacterized protein (DUF3084 family)